MKKKTLLYGIIFLIIDIVIKIIIDYSFNLMETKPIILNFFSLTKVYNEGAAWSIFSGQRIILIIISLIILVFLFFYENKFIINKRNILAFSLLYGGIVGNLLNRIFNGYVIDYLDFIIFNYDYPVFNFADICIVIGIFLLVIAIYKKEDLNEDSGR